MTQLETIIVLVVLAVILSASARRLGAPYPVFLAVGGALLAFLPGAPSFTVPPDLALALFLAPVLLDAAYDSSLRDLKDNWAPVTGLVIFAIRAVHAGHKHIPADLASEVADHIADDLLTAREIELLQIDCRGECKQTDRRSIVHHGGNGEGARQEYPLQAFCERPHACCYDRAEARNHRTLKPQPYPLERGVLKRQFLGIQTVLRPPRLRVEVSSATTILHVSQRVARVGSSTPAACCRNSVNPRWIFLPTGSASMEGIIRQSVAVGEGLLLLVGLWTPMAAMLVVIVELWTAVSRADNLRSCAILASLGAALLMLGPGVRSVDAQLFGRKRIEIRDR